MGYIGENIYISTESPTTDDYGAKAVIAWDGEKIYYNYYTQQCQKSKVCGHYTQVYITGLYVMKLNTINFPRVI